MSNEYSPHQCSKLFMIWYKAQNGQCYHNASYIWHYSLFTYCMIVPHEVQMKFYPITSCQPMYDPGTIWPTLGMLESHLLDSQLAFALCIHETHRQRAMSQTLVVLGGKVSYIYGKNSVFSSWLRKGLELYNPREPFCSNHFCQKVIHLFFARSIQYKPTA